MKLITKEYPQKIALNQLPNWARPRWCFRSDIKPIFSLKKSHETDFHILDVQCRQSCKRADCQLKKITSIYDVGLPNFDRKTIAMWELPDSLQQNCLFSNIFPVITYRDSKKMINVVDTVTCKSRFCLNPDCLLKGLVTVDE